MFGWLETGGFFSNTLEHDVVLRTATPSNLMAFGNPTASQSNMAALYVLNNSLGVKCLPRSNYNLTLAGDALFSDGIYIYENTSNGTQVICDGTNLVFSQSNGTSVSVNNKDARLSCETVVTKNILTPRHTLTSVPIISIQSTQILIMADNIGKTIDGFDVCIDGSYSDELFDGDIFTLNNITFRIHQAKTNTSGQLVIAIYSISDFAKSILPAAPGDLVDIHVLSDWNPANNAVNFETYNYAFYVDNVQFFEHANVTNNRVEVDLYFKNKTHVFSETPIPGDLYTLSSSPIATLSGEQPHFLLKLINFQIYNKNNSQAGYKFTFTSADSKLDLTTVGLDNILVSNTSELTSIYLYPLIHTSSPYVEETNVMIGYNIDNITHRITYQLSGTRLAGISPPYYGQSSTFFNYAIESITLGNRNTNYNPVLYKPFATDVVVVDTNGVSDPIFNVTRQTISYQLKGVPLKIISAARLALDSADFEVSCDYEEYLQNTNLYAGHFIFWMDSVGELGLILQCNRFTKNSVTGNFELSVTTSPSLLDNSYFLESNRFVYVIPFKYTTHTRIGDSAYNVYAPSFLSIGTSKVRDQLTVNGTASFVKELNIYNDQNARLRSSRFSIKYQNDATFNLDDKLKIRNSNVEIASSLSVGATITATDFLQYSDARLKKNINTTVPTADLNKILQINVKTFNMCNTGRFGKGVIAQELLDVYPEAVSKIKDSIAFEQPYVSYYNDCNNSLRIRGIVNDKIQVGTSIRITSLDDINKIICDAKVLEIDKTLQNDEFLTELIIQNLFCPSGFVQVTGIVDDIMMVNYEILYMSSINAIKSLHQELQHLRQQLQLMSCVI